MGGSDRGIKFVYHISYKQEEYFAILSQAYQCFRNLAVSETPSDAETEADSVFSSASSASSVSSIDSMHSGRSVSRYRQRYGRGGRVYVDRTHTSDEKDDLDKTRSKVIEEHPALQERCRFDPREADEQKPAIIDEFSIEYVLSHDISNNQTNGFPRSTSSHSTALSTRHHRSKLDPRQSKWNVKSPPQPSRPKSLNLSTISPSPNAKVVCLFRLWRCVCTNLRISQLISLEFKYVSVWMNEFLFVGVILYGGGLAAGFIAGSV